MNMQTLLRWMTMAALLVSLPMLSGCNDDDDDNGTGSNDLTGIWQRTEAGVEQETIQINADNTFTAVVADYEDELCFEFDGSYDAGADSITVEYTQFGQTFTDEMSYELTNNSIIFTDEDGSDTYTRVNTLPTCESYGFGGGGGDFWTGNLSATVDGSPVTFSFTTGGSTEGAFSFGGLSGNASLFFVLGGSGAGSYTLGSEHLATYMPDSSNPMVSYFSTSGTLTLTAGSETHIEGTFSFTGTNMATMQTISVTDGVVNITAP